ncbi:aromatic compound dioxygenase [Sodiomyces alkalinus F11]|uniref:Aromatic compound dioxygenase n=1 Tax=Sodiomyces alkalinus (strain CBS 110278 / VKM F-3762 / F11) TaxID=1314773 RepID=A0A3N2PTA2_SODAK|nr:aromatic compound dioxygenase [Sodiomyces alkalinus F11]ROT37752.1 aromatic compound dioxygenase [Sodiomyces alkalinus F11]
MRPLILGAVLLALGPQGVFAHPGHNINEELLERRSFLQSIEHRSLAHCAPKLKDRGIHERNVARRAALLEQHREKRGLKKRQVDDPLNTDHNRTDLGYTPDTDPETLFAGQNSCVLTPDVTQGPYYVGGEYVRTDVVEDQPGVGLVLDYQVIDVETCDPIPDVYLEIWHCNATGVYSGVVAFGNGDLSDEDNINQTWLRGIQPTDEDGVAQFETIFPGHYAGRATHIHLLVHTNATLHENNTLGNEVYASHVGQVFFDQALIDTVEKEDPYPLNRQALTQNADDWFLLEEAIVDGVDPFMEYALLGDRISDGIFGWLAFGINMTHTRSITPAVLLYEEGGVRNPDAAPPFPPFPGPPPTGSNIDDETTDAS